MIVFQERGPKRRWFYRLLQSAPKKLRVERGPFLWELGVSSVLMRYFCSLVQVVNSKRLHLPHTTLLWVTIYLKREGGRWLKVLFVSFCWQKSPNYFVVAIQLKIFVKVVFQMIFFSKVSLSRERQHNREDLEVSLLKMQIKRTWNAIVSFINKRFCKNSRWRFQDLFFRLCQFSDFLLKKEMSH